MDLDSNFLTDYRLAPGTSACLLQDLDRWQLKPILGSTPEDILNSVVENFEDPCR